MRIALALLLLTLSVPMSARAALTPEQRAEVAAIVRDVLRDPALLREALRALDADDQRQTQTATRNAIAMIGARLVDPQDPVRGNPMGDVTIVNFYDTRCPYCRQMIPIEAELLRLDPRVRIVDKDLPVLGATSQLEARALLAAQRQGGYYKLQASILKQAAPSTRDTLRADAERLGLDGGRLLRDLDDAEIKRRLATSLEIADQLSIQGTPALIVGDQLLAGAMTLDQLQQAVAAARRLPGR